MRWWGLLLQLLFGILWGSVMASSLRWRGPAMGSLPAEGLLWGVASFAVSLAGFSILGMVRRGHDWRVWVGHLLNHLVFGAVLGFSFLALGNVL